MATVIDAIPGPDGREVEITIEPGEIVLVVRSPDHAQPERATLSWDEFDLVTDRLRAWRRLLAPAAPPAAADPADGIATFVAALGSDGRK
jgi:hypothetical protein